MIRYLGNQPIVPVNILVFILPGKQDDGRFSRLGGTELSKGDSR